MAGELVELIRSRIDADYDGECHLTKDEALSIIGLIEHLRAEKEAEHQQFLKMGNMYVQKCVEQALSRKKTAEKAAQIAEKLGVHPELNIFGGGPEWYRHGKSIAAAIRNMGGEG